MLVTLWTFDVRSTPLIKTAAVLEVEISPGRAEVLPPQPSLSLCLRRSMVAKREAQDDRGTDRQQAEEQPGL